MKGLVVLLMIALILPFSARSAPPLSIVSTEEAPFQYTDGGALKGISIEILREVLYEIGYEGTEIQMLPWPRAYRMALRDSNTLIFTIFRTQEREELFHWTLPLFEIVSTLYKLNTRDDIHIEHEADLNKYKIGVWRDSLWHQYFIARGITNIELVSDDEFNIKKLFAGRIDLYISGSLGLEYRMRNVWRYSKEDFDKLEPVYQLEELGGSAYMAFSLNTDESLINLFSESLKKIKASGRFQDIIDKYSH